MKSIKEHFLSDGYVIIDLSVEHLEYLVQRAKQIEQLNLKNN